MQPSTRTTTISANNNRKTQLQCHVHHASRAQRLLDKKQSKLPGRASDTIFSEERTSASDDNKKGDVSCPASEYIYMLLSIFSNQSHLWKTKWEARWYLPVIWKNKNKSSLFLRAHAHWGDQVNPPTLSVHTLYHNTAPRELHSIGHILGCRWS